MFSGGIAMQVLCALEIKGSELFFLKNWIDKVFHYIFFNEYYQESAGLIFHFFIALIQPIPYDQSKLFVS